MTPADLATGIRRQRTSDLVANYIRSHILSGDYPAGEPLHQPQIASELDVSRIPVREAIIALDREGWVTIASNRRAYVSRLSSLDVEDHYELRGLVFGLVAARAAAAAGPADAEEVGRLARELHEADALGDFVSTNDRLLQLIIGLANSPRLQAALTVMPRLIPNDVEFFTLVSGSRAVADTGIAEVVRGIRSGDSGRADHAMRNLLRAHGKLVVESLGSLGLAPDDPPTAAASVPRKQTPPKKSSADDVALHIRELIISGALTEGDRLPQDEIAATVGVSRIPVRETIITLEREGWLRVEPHRGAFVERFDRDAILDHYELYGRYFGFAARRASERMTPAGAAALEQVTKMLGASESPDEVEELTDRYLDDLVEAAQSPRLRVALRSMVPMISAGFFSTVPGAVEVEKAGLAATWEAISSNDPDAAEEAFVVMSREQGKNVAALVIENRQIRS